MDRDRLVELRKKKAQAKAKQHNDLLESNASIKEAVLALHKVINDQQPYDDSKLIQQLKELKQQDTYSEDIKRLENALKDSSDKDKLDEIIKAVGNINNADVVSAVNNLIVRLEEKTISQNPDDFQPVRRVRKVGSRLVFDDDPLQVSVVGGGSGGVQPNLIDNDRVKVTVDGIDIPPIELGTVGLTDSNDTRINPSTAEGQQEIVNALENLEVDIDTTGLATEAKQDSIIAELQSIESNQLPDNHEVTANKGIGWVDPLTNDELRAAPLDVEIDKTGLATSANQTNGQQVTNERSKLDLIPYAELLTANDSITPSAGKAIEVVWVQVIANPDNTAANLVTLQFNSGQTLYKVYALGRSAVFTGAADQDLDIILDTAEPVSVNIHYREV